jgi:hypothetical protein
MDTRTIAIVLTVVVAIAAAGCTAPPAVPAGTTTVLPASETPVPAVTAAPQQECARAEDCVPAGCCHPAGCVPAAQAPACDMMCTEVCEGPLDCGAGTCGCVDAKCTVVPAGKTLPSPAEGAVITVNASPVRYSPVLSSTPGIRLEPVVSGPGAGNAMFTWRATYGRFLSWDDPGFQVHELGGTIQNHGEPVYWSFTDPAPSTETPVTISVTAADASSGQVIGTGTVVLDWEGATWVRVRE